MRATSVRYLTALPAAAMLAYLTVPFLVLVASASRADPSAFTSPATEDALRVSLLAASLATLLDGLLGIPLGLWLATTRSRFRHAVTAAVILPLAVPPVVGGLELILLLGRNTLLGGRLDLLGASPVDSVAGTVLAQMFVAAPFVIITARAAFAGVDSAAVDAARSLGCGPIALFWRVQVPLARRGLAAGLVLGWIRCLGEFGATAVLAYHPYTLPTQTFVNLSGEGLRAAIPPGLLGAAVGAAAGALALWLEARRSPRRGLAGDSVMGFPSSAGGDSELGATDLDWMRPGPVGAGITVDCRAQVETFSLRPAFRSVAGILVVLGASGAGKSLTMKVIAGLLRAEGVVTVGREVLQDSVGKLWVPAHSRRIGYVAQRDGLFDHLDVRRNVEFGIRHLDPVERARRSRELLRGLHLTPRGDAQIASLSGGERQRVALARALAPGPRALILDEAFSSLDVEIRSQLRVLVRNLQQRTGLPIIFVTHDREDALDLADSVVVLEAGAVIQQGSVAQVFRQPATATAARLVGLLNLVPILGLRTEGGVSLASTAWGEFEVPPGAGDELPGVVAIPADAARLGSEGVVATVVRVRPGPNRTLVELGLPTGSTLQVGLASDAELAPGRQVRVSFRNGLYRVVGLQSGTVGPAA